MARRPYLVIIISVVFTIVCTAAFFGLFEQELDSEDLYTPGNAQSFDDRDYSVGIFGSPAEEVSKVNSYFHHFPQICCVSEITC